MAFVRNSAVVVWFLRTVHLGIVVAALCLTSTINADESAGESLSEVKKSELTRKGADTCLKCHDDDNVPAVMPIFETKHGRMGAGTPMSGLQCESCHGAGKEHAKRVKPGETRPKIISFGSHAATSAEEQDGQCLQCHDDHKLGEWFGSAHESDEVTCAGCHESHVVKDPVLSKETQAEACVGCHRDMRAKLHKRSSHPLLEKEITCTDCHNPHSSSADASLTKPIVNETCYGCHAEKRGPTLWQHAPVDEDCTLCHDAHGSNHPDLLKQRTELLCRSCHSSDLHNSIAPTSQELPGGAHDGRSRFAIGQSCVNCHSQVHGSNHPSGSKLLR